MTGRLAGRADILLEQKNDFKGIYGELLGCETEKGYKGRYESLEYHAILFPLMIRRMILMMVMVIICDNEYFYHVLTRCHQYCFRFVEINSFFLPVQY